MMTASTLRRSIWTATISIILHLTWIPSTLGQTFDAQLLDRARAASKMIPGENPLEVRFQDIVKWTGPLSGYVEHAPDDSVPWVTGVFQIRFPSGWIMVDAGASKDDLGGPKGFSDENYEVVGEALARANMNVLTHEHFDHAPSLYRGTWADSAGKRALLTAEQIDSFLDAVPDGPVIPMSKEEANRFLVVSYDDLLPIAPGVVLVKAPGHTAGSQVVFVVLASGDEILLVGDIVWHKSQIDNGHQKGPNSDWISEDRDALESQIEWLQEVAKTSTRVVIAHDLQLIEAQIQDGILTRGLDLSR